MNVYKILQNNIYIVEYEENLSETVAELYNKSQDFWGGSNEILTATSINSYFLSSGFTNIFVALKDNEAVGICNIKPSARNANTLYIDYLNVISSYHGMGIGRKLVLLCLNRAIELNFPYLNIATWSGNTQAIPLYKKCGFMWEEKTDRTNLLNFIPTILNTEIGKQFFNKADWYKDSNKKLTHDYDGKKTNGFELFTYSWKKNRENLVMGYERFGRHLYKLITNDYSIYFMAKNHSLTFGLNYTCNFIIINKTKKPIHIEILGKSNENFIFDYSYDGNIYGKEELSANFHVLPIRVAIDKERIYPTLMADIFINGMKMTFGLGIEINFPLNVEFKRLNNVAHLGVGEQGFLNIKSNLLHSSAVNFIMPKNIISNFNKKEFNIILKAKEKCSIPISFTPIEYGYSPFLMTYNIQMCSEKFSFKRPLHLYNQSLSSSFCYENETSYNIINGAWSIVLSKTDNSASIHNFLNKFDTYYGSFYFPQLGKPFTEEFSLAKPEVKMYQNGMDMVMEAEFKSDVVAGFSLLQILTLSSFGSISRDYKITNNSDKEHNVSVKDIYEIPISNNAIFSYNNKITHNIGSSLIGLEALEDDKITENWIFDSNERLNFGIKWNINSKPLILHETSICFEINIDNIKPNESKDIISTSCYFGVFSNYKDFRAFVTKDYAEKNNDIAEDFLQISINKFNPFLKTQHFTIDVINNRSNVLKGEVTTFSSKGIFKREKCKINQESTKFNVFELGLQKDDTLNLDITNIQLNLDSGSKTIKNALFFPSGYIQKLQKNDIYEIDNGKINFKISREYSDAIYSLTTKRNNKPKEWLLNFYPKHQSFSWWNPFIGGFRYKISGEHMNNMQLAKEKIKADFVSINDNFNNNWEGIKTTLDIQNFEEYKGLVIENYYLTLPNIPIICNFCKVINKTNQYKEITFYNTLYPKSDKSKPLYAELIDANHIHHKLRCSTTSQELEIQPFIKLYDNTFERLYSFFTAETVDIYTNNDLSEVSSETQISLKNGQKTILPPSFIIISEEKFDRQNLQNFKRINFV